MMSAADRVSAVMVNYKTRDITRECVERFVREYPDVEFIVIDNGSGDESSEYVRALSGSPGRLRPVLNEENLHHGPALDQGIRLASTPFVFTMDSDAQVMRGAFLEEMLEQIDRTKAYAVGCMQSKNWLGFDVSPEDPASLPYIDPFAMLLRVETYRTLPPFRRHGAPCLKNMRAAVRGGHALSEFDVRKYIQHHGRGTADRHGYRLGFRSWVGFQLNRVLGHVRGS